MQVPSTNKQSPTNFISIPSKYVQPNWPLPIKINVRPWCDLPRTAKICFFKQNENSVQVSSVQLQLARTFLKKIVTGSTYLKSSELLQTQMTTCSPNANYATQDDQVFFNWILLVWILIPGLADHACSKWHFGHLDLIWSPNYKNGHFGPQSFTFKYTFIHKLLRWLLQSLNFSSKLILPH